MSNETDVRRLGQFVRQRRRELGITNATHLDFKLLSEVDTWWVGKTQYLETKQTEFPESTEIKALARVLHVTPEYLLFVSGYLDKPDDLTEVDERPLQPAGTH